MSGLSVEGGLEEMFEIDLFSQLLGNRCNGGK
jgi:hypothetical protein